MHAIRIHHVEHGGFTNLNTKEIFQSDTWVLIQIYRTDFDCLIRL